MKEQINLQSALNPLNQNHMRLWEWLNEQTNNRSSFIRETLFMRMSGAFITHQEKEKSSKHNDVDEVLRLVKI
ncbi:hypothetical protein [Chengkuizengella marina]|uniref:Uncharacterized protein n=1 Tax=Chengkuizengella marina TaxID=2507566 RepID=A0A6N9Q1K3_9BACL|nr:hypothetical protein [Chengkuizengella marina]NBI28080.1 hypothetical protein [Chengkuizengella marina]